MDKICETPIFNLSDINNRINVTQGKVYTYDTHTHMYNEMLVYEKFDGFIIVNDEKFVIDKPTIVLINASSFHSTHTSSKTTSNCLKISFPSYLISDYFAHRLNNPIVFKNYTNNPLLGELIKKISSSANNTEYKKIILNSILLELCEYGNNIRTAPDVNINSVVLSAIEILNRHFNEDISLNSIADSLGITPQYLSYVFSKHMNISLINYLTDIRLRYAAGLLLDNNLNITEICYLSGYKNLSHFIRSFKRKYNLSPSEYRRVKLQEN